MKYKAFTLLELLVVMALITFISVLVLPGSLSQIKSISLSGKVSEMTSQIYSYQQNAYSGLQNKSYGIRFSSNTYTIFIGNTFATAEYKEVITLDPEISINSVALAGGGSDLIFTKGTLKANTTGTVNITNTNETYQFSINKEGYIEYNKI